MLPLLFPSPPAALSHIPLLDWTGPQFLIFYGLALPAAIFWTVQRQRKARMRFESGGPPQELTDPYQVAFLAGGRARVIQLALLRLVRMGVVAWQKRWTGPRLVAVAGSRMEASPTPLERSILAKVLGAGQKGWPASSISQHFHTEVRAIEAQVAMKGLRPTDAERSKAGPALLPMFFLLALGLFKLFTGLIIRGKPVEFLVILLGITVAAMIFLAARARKGTLTAAGKATLGHLKQQHRARMDAQPYASTPATDDMVLWSMGPALLGMAAVAGMQEFEGVAEWARNHADASGTASVDASSSGCGSSGCGSSGCGGGGCGGCGGGD